MRLPCNVTLHRELQILAIFVINAADVTSHTWYANTTAINAIWHPLSKVRSLRRSLAALLTGGQPHKLKLDKSSLVCLACKCRGQPASGSCHTSAPLGSQLLAQMLQVS